MYAKEVQMLPLGSLCSMEGRNSDYFRVSDYVDKSEGIIALSPSNIEDNRVNYNDVLFLSKKCYENSATGTVHLNDIIFCKYTKSVHKSALIETLPENSKVIVNPSLIVLSEIKCDPYYLQFILSSDRFQTALQAFERGSMRTVNMASLGSMMIPLPDKDAQRLIADKLLKYREKHSELISLLQKEIEQRTAVFNEITDSLLWSEA